MIHFLFTTGYKIEKRVSVKALHPNKINKKKEQRQISIYIAHCVFFLPLIENLIMLVLASKGLLRFIDSTRTAEDRTNEQL